MTIDDIQDNIVEDFSHFDDWMDKYEYIISLGKELEPIDVEYKTEQFLINGCQSKVWLLAYMKNDKLFFKADSDAIITKGIIGLLISVLSGHSPEKIKKAQLYFIEKIGLKEHLSPNRSNGLVNMIEQMKNWTSIGINSK